MFMVETAIVVGLALLLIGLLVYIFHEKMEELAAVPLSALFDWQNLWAPLSVILLLFILGGCLPAMLFARIPVTQVFRRYTSGASWLETGTAFCSVHRSGIHSGG